jgi:hypothetical protein
MIAADIPHPPAASTTLIVSLGLIGQWQQFAALMAAVVLLTMQAFIINRLSGVCYPLWKPSSERGTDDLVATALATSKTSTATDPYSCVADQLVARKRIDTRQAIRLPMGSKSGLQVRLRTPGGQTRTPEPVNISLTGILVRFTESEAPDLPTGTRTELEIRLAGSVVKLTGEVSRRYEREFAFSFPEVLQAGKIKPPKPLRTIIRILERKQMR